MPEHSFVRTPKRQRPSCAGPVNIGEADSSIGHLQAPSRTPPPTRAKAAAVFEYTFIRRRIAEPVGTVRSPDDVAAVLVAYLRPDEAEQERLAVAIRAGLHVERKRRPTKPTAAARERRLEEKKRRGRAKKLRRPPADE